MTLDVKELRRLAEAQVPNASRGKWYARETYVYQSGDPRDRRQVCRIPTVCRPHEVDPTAAYIAAASPSTVIALLDQLAAVTAARDEACDLADAHIYMPIPADAFGPGPVTITSTLVAVDTGKPYRDRARIASLRKVGR